MNPADGNKIISVIKDINEGMSIDMLLFDGTVHCKLSEVEVGRN